MGNSDKCANGEAPETGWTCADHEDLGRVAAICQWCKTQPIRYVHTMTHPDFPGQLKVGCKCAAYMSNDREGAERRDRDAKSAASRRERWLDRKWKVSANGNEYLTTVDGFRVTVFSEPPNVID